MTTTKDVQIKYRGDQIHIGVSKTNGNIYFRPLAYEDDVWYRFEPEYYMDYKEYIADYTKYRDTPVYPNMRHSLILDRDTVEHYQGLFSPYEIYINDRCVYGSHYDLSYTLETYLEDMHTHMIPHNYYPVINGVEIKVDDTTSQIRLYFKVTIKYGDD